MTSNCILITRKCILIAVTLFLLFIWSLILLWHHENPDYDRFYGGFDSLNFSRDYNPNPYYLLSAALLGIILILIGIIRNSILAVLAIHLVITYAFWKLLLSNEVFWRNFFWFAVPSIFVIVECVSLWILYDLFVSWKAESVSKVTMMSDVSVLYNKMDDEEGGVENA